MTPEEWREHIENAVMDTGHAEDVVISLAQGEGSWMVVVASNDENIRDLLSGKCAMITRKGGAC